MKKNECLALGIMSGTSLDGVDICLSNFVQNESNWKFDISAAKTYPYPKALLDRLIYRKDLGAEDLIRLNRDLGIHFGDLILQFLNDFRISPKNIDVIGSHGHTYFHKPQEGITVQFGNGPEIYAKTNIPTICDFRIEDVALGGQGAPLVPIGDQLLFGEFESCLNLGGFANISFNHQNKRVAFDICPVNYVLNPVAQTLGKPYDNKGLWASQGTTHLDFLKELNSLGYYSAPAPKSLGAEWVEENINSSLFHSIGSSKDKLRTFCEHISDQISLVLNKNKIKNCLITGGGAYNEYLISLIKDKTECTIIVANNTIIEYKEAMLFAFLAVLKSNKEINILASVTGAKRDHSAGICYGF